MANRAISDVDTPDPWMVAANSLFYLMFTLGNRIEIWSSPSMEDFNTSSPHLRKCTVWQPAPGSPWSRDVWAPELHWLDNRWYIYTCGAPPEVGNPGHRTLVLRCAEGERDPMNAAKWEFLGPLKGMRGDQWSIDATVFYAPSGHGDWGLYCCYSGWPLGDNSDIQQDLFLVRMNSPEEAIESTLVCISKAELPWERPEGGRRGVNEGPTWIDMTSPNGQGFRGIVYSAHGSWTSEYKLGIIQLVGNDPLDVRSWKKRQCPLLVSDKKMGGPFGPGHASFVKSPYDAQPGAAAVVYCIYHGTEKEDEGWANRKARVLSMGPGCFDMNAQPLCCAYKNQFPEFAGVPGQAGGWQQYPGQSSQQQAGGAPPGHGGSGGMGAKIGGEIEKRIPQQYRGMFDKAKKMLG